MYITAKLSERNLEQRQKGRWVCDNDILQTPLSLSKNFEVDFEYIELAL
jgi:hypothetical protein